MTSYELLGEFAAYTPPALLRLIAGGMTALLYFVPNVIGAVGFAFLTGWLIDKAISSVQRWLIGRRVRDVVQAPDTPLGTSAARLRTYLPQILAKVLRVWIGLPVLYVLSLVMSADEVARRTLSQFISHYPWHTAVLAALPYDGWINMARLSWLQLVATAVLAFVYFNNLYIYFANGFELRRRVRIVNEHLLAFMKVTAQPSPRQIVESLRQSGWTEEQTKAGLWFLLFLNLRIGPKNTAVENLSPRSYGLFRIITALAVLSILKNLHPLVAALKVYFERHDISSIRRGFDLYRHHFARLPESIRARVIGS